MSKDVSDSNQGEEIATGWVMKRVIPLVALLLVIAITVGLFYFYKEYPNRIEELKIYGYLGTFIISLTFNATIILPTANMLILCALGTTMSSPVLVGLIGAVGATIGEITGYVAGRSGRDLVSRGKMYGRVEGWLNKWGGLTIFIMSIIPFVFDIVGLAAGALRFPFWKFLLFCWFGRTILYVSIITLAALGLRILLPWLG